MKSIIKIMFFFVIYKYNLSEPFTGFIIYTMNIFAVINTVYVPLIV